MSFASVLTKSENPSWGMIEAIDFTYRRLISGVKLMSISSIVYKEMEAFG